MECHLEINAQFVKDRLDAAGLTDDDRDAGTSGFCATFAFTLWRVLHEAGIESTIVVLAETGPYGIGISYEPGYEGLVTHVAWRHALVRVGTAYFDVDGLVRIEDALGNYCWKRRGVVIGVTPGEAVGIIRNCRSAWDERYRNRWRAMLRAVFLRPALDHAA